MNELDGNSWSVLHHSLKRLYIIMVFIKVAKFEVVELIQKYIVSTVIVELASHRTLNCIYILNIILAICI